MTTEIQAIAWQGDAIVLLDQTRLGVTVVGMTGVPEVVLAAGRGIPYASLCIVANPAAGLSAEPITAVVAQGAESATRILARPAAILAGST